MELNKNKITFLLIFFIWSSLFVSINTNISYTIIFLENYLIKDLASARSIFLIISLIIVNFLIFFNLKQLFKIYNIFYLLLFSVALIQGFYFFSEEFKLFDFLTLNNFLDAKTYASVENGLKVQSLQLFISYWVCMFFFFIFNKEENNKQITFTFIIFIFIFCLFYLYIFMPSVYEYIFSSSLTFYHSSAFRHTSTLFNYNYEPAIRVTGVGRSLLIISIIMLTVFCFIKKNFLKNLVLLFIIFLNLSIILLGSRFSLYSLILTYSFFIIFYKDSIKSKIKLLILFIIIPIMLSTLTINFKLNYIEYDKKIKNFLKIIKLDNQEKNILTKENDLILNTEDTEDTEDKIKEFRYIKELKNTTGRTQIWSNLKNIYLENEKKLFGFGIQADRRLLLKFKNIYGTNSSNGLIYILFCSGIVGFLLFLFANLIVLKKIYFFIFMKKSFSNFRDFYLINMSILIILILFQRSLIENSITVFGVDYLLYIVCCYFILSETKTLFFLKN